jgi:hypothetical protein
MNLAKYLIRCIVEFASAVVGKSALMNLRIFVIARVMFGYLHGKTT